ncbi:unnamed protein product [Dibothriocephalus latus]|uniref:Uncharacterized protein n=1 Tax=Dibothriocephalus latus TaxID=60516 RepID=A0A3P7MTC0_DIBLA|nr:unnamed protein product [Dibothriocephalus latus]
MIVEGGGVMAGIYLRFRLYRRKYTVKIVDRYGLEVNERRVYNVSGIMLSTLRHAFRLICDRSGEADWLS